MTRRDEGAQGGNAGARPSLTRVPPALVPATLGPYTVVETVETRAFDVTVRAERRDLGRSVQIRTLKSTVPVTSPYAVELRREASILGRLEHDGVVRLYDFVDAPDALYLVLEDARGATLGEVIQAGKVEPDPAAAIALALARAVGHVHARGVVHRALRPSAVTLTPGGGLKLGDFAAAGPATEEASSSVDRVEAGEGAGRLDHLSPEQLVGEVAGPASDVWALGVILHEMLAGALPFAAEDRKQTAAKIRAGAATRLPAEVPPSFSRVVDRCLARLPEDRFPDARAVSGALEEALAARTTLPVEVLIGKALAAARLGDEPAARGGAVPKPSVGGGPDLMGALRSLGVVAALIVVGGAVIQGMRDQEPVSTEAAPADSTHAPVGPRDRGLLKVVARPWAEVYVDGELVDVTPIGRPILVSPGKHYVTFRHPKAADEARTIKIAGGQTVFLDVTMRIDRALGDGGLDAGRDAAESP